MRRCVLFLAGLVCLGPASLLLAEQRGEIDGQILGIWQLRFTTPDGAEQEPLVLLGRQYGDYKAWAVIDGETQPFKKVELRDDTLVLTIDPLAEPDVTVTLECGLTGDNRCSGTGRFRSKSGDDSGQWTLTGKRFAAGDFDDHSTWKLRFEIPDQRAHTPLVTVASRNGRQYVWYQGRDHDLPARSFKLDGDRVEMVVAGSTEDGEDIEARFDGRVSGESVKGNVMIKVGGQSGEVPFEGSPVW